MANFEGFRPNWMAFLVVGLVLGAALYGAYRVYALPRPEHENDAPRGGGEYEGIGGWLILVIIGMVIRISVYAKTAYITLSVICDLSKLDLFTSGGSPRYDSFWYPTLLFEACGSIVILVGFILAFILMFQKKFTYPIVMVGLFAGPFVFHVVDHVLASQITKIAHDSGAFWSLILRLTIASAVWIPYFLMSERVKQTFRN